VKLIQNNNISLSKNKNKKEVMFESLDEIINHYNLDDLTLEAFVKFEDDKRLVGYIKAYSFNSDNLDFLPIWKDDLKLGDLKIVHEKVVPYNGFLIISSQEGDFRVKMMKIDKGNTDGLLKFKDYG
jgi:hypothetical protein